MFYQSSKKYSSKRVSSSKFKLLLQFYVPKLIAQILHKDQFKHLAEEN